MMNIGILIVENKAATARKLEKSLVTLGCQITSIVNASEKAIEEIEKNKPDIILMDVDIKGKMDGVDTAGIIRSRFGIPVIFMTSIPDEEEIERVGSTTPVACLVKPIQERDLKGTIEMVLYVAKAEADRKKAEIALNDSRDFVRRQGKAIARLAINDAITMGDVPRAMRVLMEVTTEIVQVDRTSVWLFSDNGEELRCIALFDVRTRAFSEGPVLKIADYPRYFETIQSKNRVCSDNAQIDPQTSELTETYLKPLGIISLLDAGIHVNGKLVGIICLEHTGKKHYWNPEEETFVNAIAALVTQTLANTERRRAEDALRTSEKKYKELANLLPQVVFETDENANLTFVNRYAFEMFKYTEADFDNGLNALQMIAPQDQSKAMSNISKVLNGEIVGGVEYTLVKKNGVQFPVILYATRVIQESKSVGLRGIIVDITDRKLIEEELKASEKRYRQIFENAQTPYFEASFEGILLEVNPAMEKTLNQTRDNLIGRSILDFFAEADQRESFLVKLKQAGEVNDIEINFSDANEIGRNILVSARILQNQQKITGSLRDITEQLKTEKALKESEAQKKAILDGIPAEISFINEKLEILWVNKASAISANKMPQEMLGKPCYSLFARRQKPCENCPAVKVLKSKKPERAIISASDGRSWDESGEPVFDAKGNLMGIVEIALDITKQKQAEEALRDSEEKYRNVVQNAIEAICVIQDGLFVYFNPEAENLFGYSAEELRQIPSEKTIYPEDRELVTSLRLRRLRGEKVRGTYSHRIVTKDGSIRWVEIKAVSINWNQHPAALVFLTDFTERKRTEELIIQNEKMLSVGGLAAGMAHELNNPLGGVLQGIQNVQRRLSLDLESNFTIAQETGIDLHNLQSYIDKRGIKSSLNGVHESGKKAAQIILNMLQFSRKSESKMIPTSFVDLIENALDLAGKVYNLEKKYDFRDIIIKREFDSNLPPVPCAKTEIEQVVLNLLKNAAQAMAEKGRKDPHHITIRLLRDENMVRIELEDNGPGMDEAVRKRIFEPFFTTKPVGDGTGLGLSVSYMIITNIHKGTMEVESELGKGTKFIIRLPLNQKSIS
ncbi:PAS domain S-box protein [bacterium]|nr:PAS domain S-box protein [bacterium]